MNRKLIDSSPWILAAAALMAPCQAQDDYRSYTPAQERM